MLHNDFLLIDRSNKIRASGGGCNPALNAGMAAGPGSSGLVVVALVILYNVPGIALWRSGTKRPDTQVGPGGA
ncbi:hypothetical protein [Halomonas kalidii]|uniref:Uncharacterized protein n=1 Tax=Halomonas kalidii TaxID=3043293 RepID=A0ABT6VNN7_9GAMM|nr:hypothetical protein [Halomonas kalidii]MDI5934548.1 hypothetical protein [Halomonas kalidii]